jgi:hypothetical protein
MPRHLMQPETLVLDLLNQAGSLTIDQVTARLPELSWSELFETIDSLSRRGTIILQRRGFQYEIRARPASAKQIIDFIAKTSD